MSILAWNCRGLSNPRAVRVLLDLNSRLRPNIIFLSETLVLRERIEWLRLRLGFDSSFSVDKEGRKGGLALFWKASISVNILSSCLNFINFTVDIDDLGRWRYTGFYGYPERHRRQASWDIIRQLAEDQSLPWCVIGDFNDLVCASDKCGGPAPSRYLCHGFRNVLIDCGLLDLGFVGRRFTWERSRGSPLWVQERLDRACASQSWGTMFPEALVKVQSCSSSDHLPIFLDLCKTVYRPVAPRFRFENNWLREPDCRRIVQNVWTENAQYDLITKIQICGEALGQWGGGEVKRFSEQLARVRRRMREFQNRWDQQGVTLFKEAYTEYHHLLARQEMFWQQRAKQFWMEAGDRNTRFYHRCASERRKKNWISKLMDSNGRWVHHGPELSSLLFGHFSELFTSSEPTSFPVDDRYLKKLTSAQQLNLEKDVTPTEVYEAVFSMHPDKSPGRDGLNPAFYQKFWSIVGPDVIRVCCSFFKTGALPPTINHTQLILLPKVRRTKKVGDLRPISLCTVLYRIIAKILSNRLKDVLPSLISETQSAFVPNRLITDNICLAYEINHFLRGHRQGKKGFAGIKIDMSKAYDRIEWRFLDLMLSTMGFPGRWIARIRSCVQTVTYSILCNASESDTIIPTRGLRQGDPLSPFLFAICAEGLSAMLRQREAQGEIHGVSIARSAPPISHLFFADDSYFFISATGTEFLTLKHTLADYGAASGQRINLQKSSVHFSRNVHVEEAYRLAAELCIPVAATINLYLGMPIVVGRNKTETFRFVRDRVWNKIQKWTSRSLSRSGKEVLIKSVAQAMPNYVMNLFLLPKTLCSEIEVLLNGFWWQRSSVGGGIRWRNWSALCAPKTAGGMGFKDLRKFNLALLGKQTWRLITCPDASVTRVLKARYFKNSSLLEAALGSNPSYIWRSIYETRGLIEKGLRRRIGDGRDTHIWYSPWLPDIFNGYPDTPLHQAFGHNSVSDLFNVSHTGWNEDFLHSIFSARDQRLIRSIPVSLCVRPDSWYWILDPTGTYAVRSAYRFLQGEFAVNDASFWNAIWHLEIPPKVRNFMWRVALGILPTSSNLQHRRVPLSHLCSSCHMAEETTTHCLFECSFAVSCWAAEGYGLGFIPSSGVFEFIRVFFAGHSKKERARFALLCWTLWYRRNQVVWKARDLSVSAVRSIAMRMQEEWDAARQRKSEEQARFRPYPTGNTAPIEAGWFWLQVDASLPLDGSGVGVGAVVFDATGGFVMARAGFCSGVYTVREGEALALKEALSWLQGKDVRCCLIHSDSQELIQALQQPVGAATFHILVADCLVLFQHFSQVRYGFVSRSANQAAHALSRVAYSGSGCSEWVHSPPLCIRDFLSV